MTRYREMISILHRFLDLLTGLRRIRERIPRAETVTALIEQRKELVSCISMCLFACEQVYAARQPLPQVSTSEPIEGVCSLSSSGTVPPIRSSGFD